MKTKITLAARRHLLFAICALLFALCLSSCATTKNALPFATTNRYGKYPVKKNKPVKNNTSWTYRQWGHQGS